MNHSCRCGAVTVEEEPNRLLISANSTMAIVSINQVQGTVKVEHLRCQFCSGAMAVPVNADE